MSFDAVTQAALPSSEVTALHLLRHPHVETGGRRLAYGHSDLPLSARGRADGAALVRFASTRLPRPDGVLSSDLRRCLDVAEPLAQAWGAPLVATAALREQAMGAWEGAAWEDLTRDHEAQVRDYWEDYLGAAPPGGESLGALAARVARWRAEAWPALVGRRWVVVTHIGVIRALACELMGLPLDQALRWAPARPSHSLFLVADTGAVLEVFGERIPPLEEGALPLAPHAWESPL